MKRSFVVKLLQSLDRPECDRFAEFLRSPYHNKDPNNLRLYELIDREILREGRDVSKAEAFSVLFPGQTVYENRVDQQKTSLLKLLHRFMTIEMLDESEVLSRKLTLDFLLDRGQDWAYERYFRKTANLLESARERSEDAWYWRYRLTSNYSIHINRGPRRMSLDNLPESLRLLEEFYHLERLMVTCRMIVQNRILGPVGELDETVDLGPLDDETGNPLIRAYQLAYRMLTEPNDESAFYALKKLLDGGDHGISLRDREDLNAIAINYCIRKRRTGQEEFGKAMEELYMRRMEIEMALEGGKLPARDFKNIVTMVCGVGELDRVEEFIGKFDGKLLGDYADNAINYGKGFLHLHRKELDKAHEYLKTVLDDHQDRFYAYDCQVYLLRCHYELNDYDTFLAANERFRVMLSRRKRKSRSSRQISHDHLRGYSIFTKIVRKLYDLRLSPDITEARKAALRKLIREKESFVLKKWCLEMLDEL